MRLVTFKRRGETREQVGVWTDRGVVPVSALGLEFDSMNDLILHATPDDMAALRAAKAEPIPMDRVELQAPIPCPMQDVLCLGLNYTEHAEEAFGYSSQAFTSDKASPIFFSKRVNWCQGTGMPIPAHADLTQRLDFENELAVILSKDALNVKPDEAADYIFGYTIVNDVSARDLQTTHKQWYFGKSLDGFNPMGPCITTADAIAFPPCLDISTTLNGELRQNSNTRMLIHGIAEIIATLTRGMTLKAGTIIATGTPKGVLMGMENPVFLKKGDVVACRIEGIGELVNTVE